MADRRGLLDEVADLLGSAELEDDLSFSTRAVVARIRLSDGRTVVAKQPSSGEAYARELRALRTLPDAVRPAYVVAGPTAIVMEDLGTGPSLADLLRGQDRRAAESALLTWAKTLGTALRATLRHGAEEEFEDVSEGVEAVRELALELGAALPGGLDADVKRIGSVLAAPGPWVAFCPGDTCPDNNRVLADGSVRFLDFEAAGWRHAAAEAAYCRAPFCTCWCVAGLPEGMTQQMETSFMGALAPPEPDRFYDAVGLAAARYTLLTFPALRRFIREDIPVGPREGFTSRGRHYGYARLVTLAGLADQIPALADVAAQLADKMRERWPESASMPPYPAFL